MLAASFTWGRKHQRTSGFSTEKYGKMIFFHGFSLGKMGEDSVFFGHLDEGFEICGLFSHQHRIHIINDSSLFCVIHEN